MLREESELPPTQMLDAHDHEEYKEDQHESRARFLRRIEKLELKRRDKIRRKRIHAERRNTLETAITEWFKRRMMELGIWNQEVSDIMHEEYDRLRGDTLRRYGYSPVLSNSRMALECAASAHYAKLRQLVEIDWVANVLVTREKTNVAEPYYSNRWCIDSGANRHLCRDVSLSHGNARKKDLVIGEAGLGHSFHSEAEGPIDVWINNKKSDLLKRTIFATKIYENILSVSEAVDQGYVMVFDKNGVSMYERVEVSGEVVLFGKRSRKNNLFYINLDMDPPKPKSMQAYTKPLISPMDLVPVMTLSKMRDIQGRRSYVAPTLTPDAMANISRTYYESTNDFDLWHPRLAHVNPRLALVAKPDLKNWPKKCFCESCTQGKFHRQAHSGTRPKPAELYWAAGEYWSCDLFGPLLRSKGGARYAAFYVDMKSRFVYAKVLQEKTDNYRALVEVIQDARARSGRPMRFFKSDGDGIFTGQEANAIYSKYSIRHMQSAPGDSASNDIAERTIRTMAELTTTNLLHAGAPPNLWAEALCMVVHVWNNLAVCPHENGAGNISRTAILEGHTRAYDLSVLRAFGTECYWMLTVQKKRGRKSAMFPKANAGVIVGIEDNMPAYRVYDLNQEGIIRKIPFSQTVTHEGHYPFRQKATWARQEEDLPLLFSPNAEAFNDIFEWLRYGFDEKEEKELCVSASSPEERGSNPRPKNDDEQKHDRKIPPMNQTEPTAIDLTPDEAQLPESESESEKEVIDLSDMPPLEALQDAPAAKDGNYNLRERKKVDYNPAPQMRRPLVNMVIVEPEDMMLSSILLYQARSMHRNASVNAETYGASKANRGVRKENEQYVCELEKHKWEHGYEQK